MISILGSIHEHVSPSVLMGTGAFVAVLLENILRSTQSKNVTGGYTKAVFFTGGLMTMCDGIVMTIIAKGGLDMLPFTITASAIGWIVGIRLHDYMTAKHREQVAAVRKAKKKEKRKEQIKKVVEKTLSKSMGSPFVSHTLDLEIEDAVLINTNQKV